MVIELPETLVPALTREAEKRGMTPEAFVLDVLKTRLGVRREAFVPRDDWERELLSIGIDCGVSLPASALTSEELYD
ncbi:MAG TPA: hypothetical protein VGE52_02515 [Pirellulales bacterium]